MESEVASKPAEAMVIKDFNDDPPLNAKNNAPGTPSIGGLFTVAGPDINPGKFRTRREAKECKGIPPISTKVAPPINCCGAICHGFC